MDRLIKAVIGGFLIALLAAAMTPSKKNEDHEKQVFLFPQLSISAAADKSENKNKNSDSSEVVFAFKLSEIIESVSKRYHSI